MILSFEIEWKGVATPSFGTFKLWSGGLGSNELSEGIVNADVRLSSEACGLLLAS